MYLDFEINFKKIQFKFKKKCILFITDKIFSIMDDDKQNLNEELQEIYKKFQRNYEIK